MAKKFPIVRARQELGFNPATGVRADIDVRVGEGLAGAAIGRGLVRLGAQAIIENERQARFRAAIEKKRVQMTDANSSVTAKQFRDIATQEFEAFKAVNPQETWEAERKRQSEDVASRVAKLKFSPDALTEEQVKSTAYTETETARALTDATLQLREDTIDAQTTAMVDAFRSGNLESIATATRRFSELGPSMGKDKVEVLNDIKAAKEAGEKLRKQDTLDSWRDRIAEQPAITAEILNNELEARKKDEGIIPEDELDSADIQSLLNTAVNRQSQLTANTQAAINKANQELEAKIQQSKILSVEEKLKFQHQT